MTFDPEESWAIPFGPCDCECDFGQAAVRLAVPRKAVGQHHDVMHGPAMFAPDHRSRRKLLLAAGREVEFVQTRHALGSTRRGALSGDVFQELDAVLVEVAKGVGLDAVGDEPNQEMAR